MRQKCQKVVQQGEFRTAANARWSPLSAEQHYTVDPPGFVWDARISMGPLMTVRVRDSYLAGSAAMTARMASLLPLADERDRTELDQGALHRYLAEAVWFPTALLPGRGVEWTAIDDSAALATLTDGKTAVSLQFRFGSQGEITGAIAAARYRAIKGGYIPTPWECTYDGYAEVGWMRVPREAEVAWLLPEGRLSYFRGHVPILDYDFD